MCGRASADKRRWPSGRSSLLFSKSSRASWRKWTGGWARPGPTILSKGWGGARSPADRIAANGQLDGALGRLLALVENYPQLKSNENFLRLQDELAGTENRIAVERRRYNEVLRDYNAYIGLFPNNVFAGWAGFRRDDHYFEAPASARQAPKVEFPGPKR